MNTAIKLMMANGWIKMEKETPAESGGGSGSEVETNDLDWLFEDTPESEEEETSLEEGSEVEEEEEASEEEQEEDEPEEVEEEEETPDTSKTDETDTPESEEEQTGSEEEEVQAPEQLTQEQIAERKEQFRAEMEKKFAISDEDANLLVTAPEEVLPRLASNITMEIMNMVEQMQMQVVQAIPQMIQGVQTQTVNEDAARNQFMELNPGLKQMDAKTLDAAVSTMAPIVKQQFPNATPQQRMEKLGKMIAAAHGIEVAKKAANKKRAPKPHTPPAPTQSSVPPAPRELTPMEQTIEELLNTDD